MIEIDINIKNTKEFETKMAKLKEMLEESELLKELFYFSKSKTASALATGLVLGMCTGPGLSDIFEFNINSKRIKYEKLIAELKSMGFEPDRDAIIEVFNSTRLELLDQVSFEIKKKYLSRDK